VTDAKTRAALLLASLAVLGALAGAVASVVAVPAAAAPVVPGYIVRAIADPARPPEQLARDADRQPAALLAFAGVKPGDRVGDYMSGGAYFTRLFSRIVGAAGHVYAFIPEEQLKNCAPAETQGTRMLAGDAAYANVTVLAAPAAQFHPPERLDVVWTSLNFHDLYDSFMGPADVPRVARSIAAALKPGGVLVVVDHVAQPDSGVRDTETLHRIDPRVIVRTFEAAGLHLEAQSDLLRNRQDTHELRVFDPAIRGHTDQVILRFRKLPQRPPA
jgi:predicted methyltransferase